MTTKAPAGRLAIALLGGGILALAGTVARAELEITEWKQHQAVDVPAPGLVKLLLPPETLDLARPDLADLRVVDPAGREVAYAGLRPEPASPRVFAPQHFIVEQKQRTTEIRIVTGSAEPITALELAVRRGGVVKPARIETSPDGVMWQIVADALQFAPLAHARWIQLPLAATVAAQLRITLDDERTLPVAIDDVRLTAAAPEPESLPVSARIARREEFARETVLTVDLGARHLALSELTVDCPDNVFSREVTITQRTMQGGQAVAQALGRARLFRTTSGTSRENLRIALQATTANREIELRIANGNSAPLQVRGIAARRAPRWIVFNSVDAGTHQLLTGNSLAAAPQYDLNALAADFQALPVSALPVKAAEPTPGYKAPDAAASSALLGAPLDIRDWAFRKLITHGSEPTQQIELDLEVLAHAQPGLSDLRLVRDDRQVPYLLERTSLERSLRLMPSPADEKSEPQVSRWTIVLPLAGIPLRRLTIDSAAPLFSREVRLYEQSLDVRGEVFRRELAAPVHWTRSPAQEPSPLTIELHSTPATGTLVIEMELGDNAPISLGSAEGFYPATRLLFRTDAEPLYLYYGEPRVSAPRYDLELVAGALLQADAGAARLGNEEKLKPADRPASGGRGGPLLWVALGAVVIVLLVAIARLLPKPPPAAGG